MNITLRQLTYFKALAEQRNFGRAAEVVHVSQPALSVQIRELEKTLGAALVEPQARDVVLTPFGRRILTHAETVLVALGPGDRHSLGMAMAAELFRQHGWDVQVLLESSHDDIMDRIALVSCLVLGLSSGGPATRDALTRLVHAVRVTYPHIFIIISGQIVAAEPQLIEALAPDSAVSTVEDALKTMERLWS